MFRVTMPRTQEEVHVTFSRRALPAAERPGQGRARPAFLRLAARSMTQTARPIADSSRWKRRTPASSSAVTRRLSRRSIRCGAAGGSPPRLLVILGASGAGKSSFLRAGLLPRLARDDRNFLPLPVIRPERAAISGETGLFHALESALSAHGLPRTRASLREAIAGGAEKLRPLLQQLVDEAFATVLADESKAKPPVIVLAIDQAEELFLGEGPEEGQALPRSYPRPVKEDHPGIIALFTIRSDSYDRLETAKVLEGMRQQTLPLLPMPRGAYQTVIEGPAARLKDTTATSTSSRG